MGRVAALLIAAVTVGAPVGADDSARAVVEQTVTPILEILKNDKLSKEEKRQKIERIVDQHVDYPTVSRLVLGANWAPLGDSQKQQFIAEFKQHLSVTYSRNIESYNNQDVQILSEREEARGDWTVRTEVERRNAKSFAMDYRLRKIDGEWRIIDVVIEGISLVSSFRSQFQEIVSHGGIDRLLQVLHEKNARGEPLKQG